MNENIHCLSFSNWLTSLSIIPSSSIHIEANGGVFVVSNGWGIFHCIHRPHLLYPLIFRWTPRLLSQFGYHGHCCSKHRGAGVPAFHCIWIFGVNPQQCNCWVIGQVYFNALRNLTQFSKVTAPVHIPTNSVRGFPFLCILSNICGFLPC